MNLYWFFIGFGLGVAVTLMYASRVIEEERKRRMDTVHDFLEFRDYIVTNHCEAWIEWMEDNA